MTLPRRIQGYTRRTPPVWDDSVRALPDYEYLGTNEINGKRHYNISGNLYPSVTTFIAERSDNSWLDDIASVIGEEKLKRLNFIGAKNGSSVHDLCEHYIRGEVVTCPPTVSLQWRALWKNVFEPERIGKLYLVEGVVASHKLKIAGRTDLIADFDGEPHVIDYKNVSEIRSPEHYTGYWIQLSLYSIMFKEMYGRHIPKLAIIMSSSTGALKVMKSDVREHLGKLKDVLNGGTL